MSANCVTRMFRVPMLGGKPEPAACLRTPGYESLPTTNGDPAQRLRTV